MYLYIIWLRLLTLSDAIYYFANGYEDVCYENITKLKTLTEVTKEPYQVRQIRFCWNLPPMCSLLVTKYKDVFREERIFVSEEVSVCCEGWKEQVEGDPPKCIPMCEEQCQPYGTCIQPNVCLCHSGVNKSRCTKDDDNSFSGLHRTMTTKISKDTQEELVKTLNYSTTADAFGYRENYSANYAMKEHDTEMIHTGIMVEIEHMDNYSASGEVQFESIFTSENSSRLNNLTDISRRIPKMKNIAKTEKPLNILNILLIFLAIFILSFILTCTCIVVMKMCIRRQMNSFYVKKLSIKDLNKGKSIFSSPQDGVLGSSTTTTVTTRDAQNVVLEDLDDILGKLECLSATSDNNCSQCCRHCSEK